MKPVNTILVIVLIIAGFIPVPFLISSFFGQDTAALMLQLGNLTLPMKKLLVINGAYILSFVAILWVAAFWIIRSNPAGTLLALVLGIIRTFRGLLMIGIFGWKYVDPPFLAIVSVVDGSLIILLAWMSLRGRAQS